MNNKILTVKQFYIELSNAGRYAIAETTHGEIGVNCQIAKIARRLVPYRPERDTDVYIVRPCSMHEYISKKIPLQ